MRQIGVPWIVQVRHKNTQTPSTLSSQLSSQPRSSINMLIHTKFNPTIPQVFYGTLLMIGMGVLAFAVFSASFVFGFLFLLAFAAFRLFSQRPHLARQVLQRPAQTPAGAFLRPFLDMVTEGVMMDGLKNARCVRGVCVCVCAPCCLACGTTITITILRPSFIMTLLLQQPTTAAPSSATCWPA